MVTSWRDDAACLGDNNAWFDVPSKHTKNQRQIMASVLAVCEACPSRVPCLDWALSHNETHGVWGGMLPRERRAMRKRKR